MKIKKPFLQLALIVVLGLNLPGSITAQTFTNLHNFTFADGIVPTGSLILSGNTLYGTTGSGGTSSNGTVFKVNTDGTSFTNLHHFTTISDSTNSDGAFPGGYLYGGIGGGGLVLSGNTLYGTANVGGASGNGAIYKLNTDGTGFTNLHSFTASSGGNSDGANPVAELIVSGSTLYGMTTFGGVAGNGAIFKLNTDGTGFINLHSFAAASNSFPYGYSEGVDPIGGLILSGNILYGTTDGGGSSSLGTVFAININGSGFTNLHNFDGASNGTFPDATLVLSGNTLYGTTTSGGIYSSIGPDGFIDSNGTVFKLNTDGTGFTNLHSFVVAATNAAGHYTNSEGTSPSSKLIVSGNTLYGTATGGGSSGSGTVFALHTDGTGFGALYDFTASTITNSSGNYTNRDGAFPYDGLILSGNILFGTAASDGSFGSGTVFSLTLSLPQLTLIRSGDNIILAWPTNFVGLDYSTFTLQSTTNLVPSAAWTTVSPGAIIVNGQNTVTNLISGPQKFYRLSQ